MSTIIIAKSSIVGNIIFNFNIVVVSTKNIKLKNNIKIVSIAVKIVSVVAIVVTNIESKNNFKTISIIVVVAIDNFEK